MTRFLAFVALAGYLTTHAVAGEPESLFNGKDLTGWDGDPQVWSVEDGAITGRTTAEAPLENNSFLIWKGGQPDDFRLSFEYRIPSGNSGMQYRSRVVDPEKWIVAGYQADFVAGPQYTGIIYEERGRGILAHRGQRVTIDAEGEREIEQFADAAELQEHVREGDWNEYVVEARGARLRQTINGQLMSELVDNDEEHRAASGVLAIQVHRGPPMVVQVRNIVLERLEREE